MNPSELLVVFDLDGTLVDAFGDIQAAVNDALRRRELPTHDIQTIRGFVGNGLRKLCERATPPHAQDQLEQILAETRDYYSRHPVDHAHLYPGIARLLEDLRRLGVKTAILSNKTDQLVERIARELGLDALVDQVIGERPGVPIKPDPTPLLELGRAVGAQAIVLVGDGLPDAQAARRAGARFLGVTWGIEPPEVLGQYGPTVGTAAEILDAVRGRLLEP